MARTLARKSLVPDGTDNVAQALSSRMLSDLTPLVTNIKVAQLLMTQRMPCFHKSWSYTLTPIIALPVEKSANTARLTLVLPTSKHDLQICYLQTSISSCFMMVALASVLF